MSLEGYWRKYDETLARIRSERPDSFAGLKLILDEFEPPSSGDAFFPDGADDTLADALSDAGWRIAYSDGTYVYRAFNPTTSDVATYVEGDLYKGSR